MKYRVNKLGQELVGILPLPAFCRRLLLLPMSGGMKLPHVQISDSNPETLYQKYKEAYDKISQCRQQDQANQTVKGVKGE